MSASASPTVINKSLTQKTQPSLDNLEKALIEGDLAGLNTEQRHEYYSRICESVGLNPLTKPFEYQKFNGRVILYARKEAAEQLRQIYDVSILSLDIKLQGDIYTVTAQAERPLDNGRIKKDVASGAVSIKGLYGEALANASMKAETKAKRRVTLSICGLSFLDESEIESMKEADKPEGTPEIKAAAEVIIPQDAKKVEAEILPPETDLNEKIQEDVTPKADNEIDEKGFKQDPNNPFVKNKVAEPKMSTMQKIAGEMILPIWEKYKDTKLKDIPQDELLDQLSKIERGSTIKPVPEDWKTLYSNACTYLNRKQDLKEVQGAK